MTENKVQDVYSIKEREGEKSVWIKIGVAFLNRDDSFNVLLDALPVDGKLHIRKRNPKQRGGYNEGTNA